MKEWTLPVTILAVLAIYAAVRLAGGGGSA